MDERKLIKEYETFLLVEGRRTKGIKYAYRSFTKYLDEYSIELLQLDYQGAQGFQNWLTEQSQRYSTGTILGILGPLSAFYDYLKKKKYVYSNPFTMIDRLKKPVRLPGRIPDEKEMDELLLFLRSFTRRGNLTVNKGLYKAHVLCELLYSTGMRISEAAAIKTEDVDLIRGTVIVHDSKTRKVRTAFLNEYTCSVLSIYINEMREKVLWLHNGADPSLLFGSSTNLTTWLCRILADACENMGREKVTTHIFRHAFGYHMLRAGCDIRKIQKFLGHERLNTTSIYAKVDTQALRNVLDRYHPRRGIS